MWWCRRLVWEPRVGLDRSLDSGLPLGGYVHVFLVAAVLVSEGSLVDLWKLG